MFRFGDPSALYWLAVLPLVLVVLVLARRWRRMRIAAFGHAEAVSRLMPYASGGRWWARNVLYLLALALLVVGLARPQFGVAREDVKGRGSEIMVVLDVSRSMLAEDVKPSRLERAKLEISKLVSELKRDRVGLILFAGRAYVQLPITSDFAAAQLFLQSVNTDMIQQQGTVMGEALSLAMKSFGPSERMGKAIVLISDGESHDDDPLSVARQAAKEGIRIFTVGFGSPSGSLIRQPGGGVLKDAAGNPVVTRLDEKTLADIASTTGGVYLRAEVHQGSLSPIISRIEDLEKGEYDKVTYTRYNEQFQPFLLVALLLVVLASAMLERKNRWLSLRGVKSLNKH
ncbi:MAG: hypothetical protein CSA07_01645 [Bacteroidia bacterium]|nr:MAG: hypothetical protein CSA07_01645 [Bacteroidia bacterium]